MDATPAATVDSRPGARHIILVNPVSGRGHLDAYARLYSRALLELGYRVTLLAKDDGGTRDYLRRQGLGAAAGFDFVSFAEADQMSQPSASVADRSALPITRRAALVWRQEGGLGLLRRLAVIPARTILLTMPAGWQSGLKSRLQLLRSYYFRWLGIGNRISFVPLVERVNAFAAAAGDRDAMVFFLYLDMMSCDRHSLRALDMDMDLPWAGIRFHPSADDIEDYFATARARGALFLVPGAVERYAKTAPDLAFHLVPDVADSELPEAEPPFVREIRKRAGERKIVLLAGSIAPHKGVMDFIEALRTADPARFFFVIAGEVYWETFGADAERLASIWNNPPENLAVHDGYIAEERDYNALLQASDILYAVYRGFDSSSNSLTKAALFRKPILVSSGTLMGNRVIAHRIGDAAQERDPATIVAALERLAAAPRESFGFDRFLMEHSLDGLKTVLATAIPDWYRRPPDSAGGAPVGQEPPASIRTRARN